MQPKKSADWESVIHLKLKSTRMDQKNKKEDPVLFVLQSFLAILLYIGLLLIVSLVTFRSKMVEFIGSYWLAFTIMTTIQYLPTFLASIIGVSFYRAFSKKSLFLQLFFIIIMVLMPFVIADTTGTWKAMFSWEKISQGVLFIIIGYCVKLNTSNVSNKN